MNLLFTHDFDHKATYWNRKLLSGRQLRSATEARKIYENLTTNLITVSHEIMQDSNIYFPAKPFSFIFLHITDF